MDNREAINLLDEYIHKAPYKSRMNIPLLVLSISISIIVNWLIYQQSQPYYFEWESLLILLAIPGIALILCFIKTRTGWFIATVYYSLLAGLIIIAVVSTFTIERDSPPGLLYRLKQIGFMALIISVVILYWSNAIRRHYQVKPLLSVITVMFIILLIIAAFVMMVEGN